MDFVSLFTQGIVTTGASGGSAGSTVDRRRGRVVFVRAVCRPTWFTCV